MIVGKKLTKALEEVIAFEEGKGKLRVTIVDSASGTSETLGVISKAELEKAMNRSKRPTKKNKQ